LEQTYELVEQTIERLQLIYRPINPTLVESTLGSMFAEREDCWRASLAEQDKELEIDRPTRDQIGLFDPSYLGRGLDALVAWRAAASPAGTRVRFGWRCRPDEFRIRWTERESSPRAHVDVILSTRVQDQTDSLALPMLARIISAHAGRLVSTAEPDLSLNVSWPRKR
jgi:hypothetical protein